MEQEDELPIGHCLAERFVLRAKVGGGSFGFVYSAHDVETNRAVAVKLLRNHAIDTPELVARFEREATICAELRGPHTARFHEFGTAQRPGMRRPVPFIVFDLVRGASLARVLSHRRRLTVEETVHILVQVLDSLEEAHQLGILHRDLKPDNVMLVPPARCMGEPADHGDVHDVLGIPPIDNPVWQDLTQAWVRVVDFGLGKMLEVDGRKVKPLTKAGMAAGTANYMSPEQLKSVNLDFRADIYGVAMLMHRMLTGHETYHGKTVGEVAMQQLTAPLPPLPGPLANHPIGTVFAKAGAKDREQRYVSAAEMAHALRCVVDPALAAAAPPTFTRPPEVRESTFSALKRWLRG